jgi:hypothetical protein
MSRKSWRFDSRKSSAENDQDYGGENQQFRQAEAGHYQLLAISWRAILIAMARPVIIFPMEIEIRDGEHLAGSPISAWQRKPSRS